MKILHPYLYLFVLGCSVFVLAVSFGEMLWGPSAGIGQHWTEKMFYGICHQLPDRTYHTENLFMAVNTRCFGIFAGNATGWLLMPFLIKFTLGNRWPILLLLAAAVIQVVDFMGNMIDFWENTNHSRALLGSVFGLAIPLTLSDMFYPQQSKQ